MTRTGGGQGGENWRRQHDPEKGSLERRPRPQCADPGAPSRHNGTVRRFFGLGPDGLDVARRRSATLTEAEFRLMEVLWDREQATVAEVTAALPPPPIAYNSVLTTMR